MLTDIQLTILAIVATAAGTIIIFGYFLGLILKNQRLQLIAKEEILEWGSTIFMIGALTFLLAGPIPEFSCKTVSWILGDSVDCADEAARIQYVNESINENIRIAYQLIASPKTTQQLTKLLQGSLSRTVLTIPIGVTAFRNPFNDAAGLSDVLSQSLQFLETHPDVAASTNLGGELRGLQQLKEEIANARLGGTTVFSYQPCNYFLLYYNYAIRYINMFTQYKTTLYVIQLLVTELYKGFVWGFLVVGLLLRSFNISRRIGGFLISFAIAVALLPYITVFFIKIIQKVDDRLWTDIADRAIDDIKSFTSIRAVKDPDGNSYRCTEDINLYSSDFKQLYSVVTSPTSGIVSFSVYGFMTMLALGMSLLAVISITVGIGQLFGIEISPFVLSYIARLR